MLHVLVLLDTQIYIGWQLILIFEIPKLEI